MIHVRSWRCAYRGLVPDRVLDGLTVSDRARRWVELLAGGSETYLADGGFCSIIRPARDVSASVEVAALYVDPSRWGRGIGGALLRAALAPGDDVSLWVFAENERARGFYRAQGFADDGAQAIDPATGVLEVRMWRPARSPA